MSVASSHALIQMQSWKILHLQNVHMRKLPPELFSTYFLFCKRKKVHVWRSGTQTQMYQSLQYDALTSETTCTVWMDAVLSSDNSRKSINIAQLAELPQPITVVLPGIHAFTGCDYTASFMGKDKTRPFQLMVNDDYTRAYGNLGHRMNVSPEDVELTEVV